MVHTPSLNTIEQDNLAEIERLNQRGGRTLSVVDLIEADTITAEMAAFCAVLVRRGASFLTGAVPGGVGKTTLMGALLSFLPPGEAIVTVSDASTIAEALGSGLTAPTTVVAHEIGPASWLGYLWAKDAVDFLRLSRQGLRPVSCLHSDDPAQTRSVLTSLGVAQEDLDSVRLQLYIRFGQGRRPARRVDSIHCRFDGELRAAYRWRPDDDSFERLLSRGEVCEVLAAECDTDPQDVAEEWGNWEALLAGLLERDVCTLPQVRQSVLGFLSG